MPTQPIAPAATGPARHRRTHTAATIAATAALIATGGYLATTTNGPDTTPHTAAPATDVHPSTQTLREMRQSIAGQYGNQSTAGAVVSPSAQTLRELHQSIAGQYGNQSAAGAVVNPNAQVRRELRDSIAAQYGPAR